MTGSRPNFRKAPSAVVRKTPSAIIRRTLSAIIRRTLSAVVCRTLSVILRRTLFTAVSCLVLIAISSNAAYSQESPYNKGVGLYTNKKYAEALAVFETGKIDTAQAANAAYYRALCYHQLGKLKEAAAAYRYVFSKYPESAAARNSLKTLAMIDPASAKEAMKNYDPVKASPIDWTGLPEQVVVPFRKARGGGLFVQAEMNGTPITMIFDTGASATTCTETFLSSNSIQTKRTNYHGRTMGIGGEVSTSLAMVDMRLGDMKRKIPILIQDDRGLKGTEHAPLLGQTFFGDLPYSIDDARGVIIFSKPANEQYTIAGPGKGKQPRLADNEVPFRRVGGNIVVTVKVNGRECEMYFDTGADTIAFADRHLAQCGLNRPTDAYSSESAGVGGRRDAFGFNIDSIKLGSVEKRNVRACVLINANFDRPLLGQTFLSGLKYTIDPSRNLIRFE